MTDAGPTCPIPISEWESYAERLRRCLAEAGHRTDAVTIDDDLGPGIHTSVTERGVTTILVPGHVANRAMEVAGLLDAWRER